MSENSIGIRNTRLIVTVDMDIFVKAGKQTIFVDVCDDTGSLEPRLCNKQADLQVLRNAEWVSLQPKQKAQILLSEPATRMIHETISARTGKLFRFIYKISDTDLGKKDRLRVVVSAWYSSNHPQTAPDAVFTSPQFECPKP